MLAARFGGAKRDILLVPLRFTVDGWDTIACSLARFPDRLRASLLPFPVFVSGPGVVNTRRLWPDGVRGDQQTE